MCRSQCARAEVHVWLSGWEHLLTSDQPARLKFIRACTELLKHQFAGPPARAGDQHLESRHCFHNMTAFEREVSCKAQGWACGSAGLRTVCLSAAVTINTAERPAAALRVHLREEPVFVANGLCATARKWALESA